MQSGVSEIVGNSTEDAIRCVQYKDPAGNLFPLVVDASNFLEKSIECGIDNRSARKFENNSIASELVNLEASISKRNNDSKLNSVEDKLAPDEVRFRF
ncbi:hypothetical protein L1887_36363 [Cichorium endivia]|nr:hypothetical protein L1887_36363 [Cichorium endivia]